MAPNGEGPFINMYLWIEISVVAVRLTKDIYVNFQDKMLLILNREI